MGWLGSTWEDLLCRRLCWTYRLNGFKRIYHIHIRKTGGTSLNNMFLALAPTPPWASLYVRLVKAPHHRVIHHGLVFVGWNPELINQGRYFYAFSHVPIHQLRLPAGTFTVTCFRDPARRVLSHYRMLLDFRTYSVPHPCMATEGPWLGGGFMDFLERIPREHLLNQLYMFSEDCDVGQALARARQVSCCLFLESFAKGIEELNGKTGLKLRPLHTRKTDSTAALSDAEMAMLRERLAPEYTFLAELKNKKSA